MRGFAVLFALACCWSGEAARVKQKEVVAKVKELDLNPPDLIMEGSPLVAKVKELDLNPPDLIMEGSPLVRGLVSAGTSGTLYKVKEKLQIGNNYVVKKMVPGGYAPSEEDALVFKGKWKSKFFGHGSIHIKDPSTGKEIFKIRRSRHAWNPVEWVGRFSYRILPPGSKSNRDAIFTINKDIFGRGFAWQKEEWRIYRGTQTDGELAYYCVGSYLAWDTKCYHSVRDYDTGRDGLTVWGAPEVSQLDKIEPVAELSQKLSAATLIGGLGSLVLPDALYVKVQHKADSALFCAFAAIIDTAHDISGKGNVVDILPIAKTPIMPGSSAHLLPTKALESVIKGGDEGIGN